MNTLKQRWFSVYENINYNKITVITENRKAEKQVDYYKISEKYTR